MDAMSWLVFLSLEKYEMGAKTTYDEPVLT